MTLKPPTRTLPKLVMKEWPEPLYDRYEKLSATEREFGKNWDTPKGVRALSDFTRVVEETGILEQEEAPLTKPGSKHD